MTGWLNTNLPPQALSLAAWRAAVRPGRPEEVVGSSQQARPSTVTLPEVTRCFLPTTSLVAGRGWRNGTWGSRLPRTGPRLWSGWWPSVAHCWSCCCCCRWTRLDCWCSLKWRSIRLDWLGDDWYTLKLPLLDFFYNEPFFFVDFSNDTTPRTSDNGIV